MTSQWRVCLQVSVRLHDELELIEEKRARYEEELDRVNDILTDSENSRLSLQKEIDNLNNEVTHRPQQLSAVAVCAAWLTSRCWRHVTCHTVMCPW